MKKLLSALIIGACAGALASLIVFFKGLDIYGIGAYFSFWMGISLIIAFTFINISWWLKGLLLSELTAIPFIVMTLGSYKGEPLVYIIVNIILINAFLGMAVGYFNGLAAEDFIEEGEYIEGLSKKIAFAVLFGIVAGLIDLIPISLSGEQLTIKLANIFHWIALSVIISFLNIRIKDWLAGFITVMLTMIPVGLLFSEYSAVKMFLTLVSTGVLGAVLGAFNGKFAKVVVQK